MVMGGGGSSAARARLSSAHAEAATPAQKTSHWETAQRSRGPQRSQPDSKQGRNERWQLTRRKEALPVKK